MSNGKHMDTAIIGMAFRLPGANDCDAYWRNLAERRSSVIEVPPERWDWRRLWGDPKLEVNRTFSKWAGFIDDVDAFDHEFFGFLPKVVHNMDPQQRIMLELAWASFEDAGIPPSSLAGRRVGVFTGVTHHDYKELLAHARVPIEPYHYTGTATVVVPNRVSHVFGLRGPSIPVDTACSSSLNAIHLAIQSFESGECDLALAGGISLILNPARHVSVSKMGTLSPTGSCKTLDDRADGYVRGEGAGFFVLKPLEKALADKDLIYGVIKGSAVNHCGKTHTLSYPSADAQADVIVAAHRRAGVPVSSVNFIELHGTGTPKGDPIEFDGLCRAYSQLAETQGETLDTAFCGLSSAKTNIGHLEAAAGMAGVAKVLLAFRHRQLPGFHDFRKLNSRVSIESTPFYILDETRAWPRRGESAPLRAGVSSFGFGGTNAHLVLEEAPETAPVKHARKASEPCIIALSARTPGALQRRRRDLLAWLRGDRGEHGLVEISRTLLLERDHLAQRLVWVVDGLEQLEALLSEKADETVSATAADEDRRRELDLEAARVLAGLKKLRNPQRRKALEALAVLFRAGAEVRWAALYPDPPARRLRLPVYAFERNRFWLPESEALDDAESRRTGDGPLLHPLLHRNAPTLDMQRFLSVFDGGEFFLADHRVRGKRMLPGVAYLEMVRAGIVKLLGIDSEQGAPPVVRIADVVWLRPLVVEDRRVAVEVDLSPIDVAGHPAHLDFEFRISIHEDDAATQALCRGLVSIEPVWSEAEPALGALEAGAPDLWRSADAIYADFAEQGLDYGPGHRILQELRLSPDYALAKIELPLSMRAGSEAYTLHPGIADAALQSAVAFSSAAAGGDGVRAAIPFALDEALIRRAPAGPVHAYVRRSSGAYDKFDIDILDDVDGGAVCAAFRGLSVRPIAVGANDVETSAGAVGGASGSDDVVEVPVSLAETLYVTEWRMQPAAPVQAQMAQLLLVGPRQELDWAEGLLRASPRFAGTRIERIVVLEAGEATENEVIAVRPGVLEDYGTAVTAVAARGAALQRVLLVPSHAHHHRYVERIATTAKHVFALAKAMFRVTRAVRFLHLAPPFADNIEHLALGGLFKALRMEKPDYSGRVIDGAVADGGHGHLADIVADEFLCEQSPVDVRYRDGRREVRGFAAVGASVGRPADPDAAQFREGGAYLVTGGLGALGRIVARHLCARYRAHVYLTGRSAPGEAQQAAIAEIAALGGTASYLVCDVADRDDVRRAVAAVHADGHRLSGVLHSAGIIEDAFLLRKSADEFARVISPKTFGTWNLDEETRDEPLDMFVLFSSVAGALGNVGQCDYAYGNAFEDAFAHARDAQRRREQRSGKSLSINWPFWLNGGMRLGEAEIEAVRRTFGIVPLMDEPGLQALEFALAQGEAQLLVMPGDAARVREVIGAAPPPAAKRAFEVADAEPDPGAVSAFLAAAFARQLDIAAEIEPDKSFKDYGFDSVVMIELVALLEKTFGILPKTLFFEYPNLGELTAYFVDHHPDTCRNIGGSVGPRASAVLDADAVAAYLAEVFSGQLGIDADFEPDKSFKDYGFDSVVMIELTALLEKTFGTLPKTLFFEHPNLGELAGYFLENHAAGFAQVLDAGQVQGAGDAPPAAPAAVPRSRAAVFAARRAPTAYAEDDPIAIIGLAGRYPQAETLDAFWDNLKIGRDCIEPIPEDRPDIAVNFRFRPGEPAQAHSYARWGGFVRDVDRFDAAFFNISPKEAENIDPNERLFLEVAAHAIEDAGYTPDTLATGRGVRENPVGVYVGLMWGDYQLHGVDRPRDAWATPHSFYWAVANRVSYQFNFSGPSLTLDTACSSSLTAIHMACQAIRQGEIEVAIAGASNLSLHPNKYNLLADMHFLSSDGRCRAFGEGGDGYVPGEGVGAVVLKPLSKARRDGDHVYAVIRGSAINHGGKASGFTVPSAKRQTAVIREAMEAAGVDPRHITYVEAHGTGTRLGDPIEIGGLSKAFAQSERQYCAIGSVKANIGHLEAASGIAGLTKVLLQLKHRLLVPSIHSDTLNPFIDFADSPFRVQRSLQPWPRPTIERDGALVELPRLAGLSSFGAGGANGHLVIEEHLEDPRNDPRNDTQSDMPVAIVLSARKENALRRMALRLAQHLHANPDITMADAAYTLQVGRTPMEFRAAFVVAGREALLGALSAFGEQGALLGEAWSGHRDAARLDGSIAARVQIAAARMPEWLAQRDLSALSRAWVDGVAIDWPRLHVPDRRRRVPLPGYAFERQRYWVPPASPNADATASAGGPKIAALHPLIDTNVSTLEEQAFDKTFRAEEFFLDDHRLGDNRILPGVVCLEMAMQAARLGAPGHRVVALRDVCWRKPVVVGAEPVRMRIALCPERDVLAFELYDDADEARTVHAEGTIQLQEAGVAGNADASSVDLDAIRARCRSDERPAIDAAFAAMGFAFGDSFRVFERLHYNDSEALGDLRLLPIPGVRSEDFALHPALLDGAFRASLGIGGIAAGAEGIRVPTRLGEIEVLGPLGQRVCVHVRRAHAQVDDGQQIRDLDLCDPDGRVRIRIRGLVSQAAPQLAMIARRPTAARATTAIGFAAPAAATVASALPTTAVASQTIAIATALLRRLLSDATKLPIEQIDAHAPLENYGIDSVMIAALNRALETRFGDVPKTLFFEHLDIAGVAAHLAEQYGPALLAMAPEYPEAAGVGMRSPDPLYGTGSAVAVAAQTPMAASITDEPASVNGSASLQATVEFLKGIVAETTGLSAVDIDPLAPMENYGIDSVMVARLTGRIEQTFGPVSKTLFFEHQEIVALARHLAEAFPEVTQRIAIERGIVPSAPVAVDIAVAAADRAAGDPEPHDSEAALARLYARMREIAGVEQATCTVETPIADWSLDPLQVIRLLHALGGDFAAVDAFAPYRHLTLGEWAARLRWKPGRATALAAQTDAASAWTEEAGGAIVPQGPASAARKRGFRRFAIGRSDEDDMAIVGLSGHYPGADDLDAFWRNLAAGRDGIGEVPLSRWDHARIFHPDRSHKGTAYSKWGGFMEGIDRFDARFFNISAREAELMDPQERLFLQTAWECVEDACYTRQSLKGRGVGVFVGVAFPYYSQHEVSDEQLKSGRPSTTFSSIANRVSYFMHFNGPSMAVDTMCSSSLTAIHLAIRAIQNGDCDQAIAGGVNLITHRNKYLQLCASQFLSTDGRCRAFGEGGDGYVPGEGVGAVLLKPLRRALDDGDHVYGIIKASALNHGGKTNGYTVPNQPAQTAVIGKALRRSGWDPRTIDYIEAHGTGTSLGDPIEIAGLSRAFSEALVDVAGSAARLEPQRCRIGSIKSNVGHLESAAAIAGLTKILMQFRHGAIAPSLHSSMLNPNIDFSRSPFRVVQRQEGWPAQSGGAPRRAGLSSFGAGGSNAHCLVEDHRRARPAHASGRPVLFVLSADSAERLGLYVDRIIAFLERGGDPDVGLDAAELAYASQIGREAMTERLAVVATNVDDLLASLRRYAGGDRDERTARGTVRDRNDRLEAIVDEAEKDTLIRSLIGSGRLPQLARAWTSMLDVDWSRHLDALYPAPAYPQRPRRMPFPTMPFLTERYWIDEKADARTAGASLHPLVDANVSTLSVQAYHKRFDGQEFYLRDHIVRSDRERTILPGAAYLEMARAAGELAVAGDGLHVATIRNLMWMQPFEIGDAPDGLTIRMHTDEDALRFEIARDSDDGRCVEGELGCVDADAREEDDYLDIAALLAAGALIDPGPDAIYDAFQRMGFLFGPAFRITRARYRLAEGALCHLRLPEHLHAGLGDYGMHPTMLDAVLRSGLAVDAGEGGQAMVPIVPFALDALEYRHPLGEECYVLVTRCRDVLAEGGPVMTVPGAEATAYKYDLIAADRDGRVLLKLSGFAGRALIKQPQARSRALQYFGYEWAPAPLHSWDRHQQAHTVLCIATSSALTEALARSLPAGTRLVPVLLAGDAGAAGAEAEQAVADRFDPFEPDSAERLFAALRGRGLMPDRIVYCDQDARADAVDAFDGARDAPQDALHRGIQAVRRLFVAAERGRPASAMRLLYVFADGDPPQPQHEAVYGYARSLLTVNHRFELSTLRDDRSDVATRARAIADELTQSAGFGGNEIACRGGLRLRRSLRNLDAAYARSADALGPLPLRGDGVYLITGGGGKLGLLVARYLAERGCGALVLSGRSRSPSDILRRDLEALRALGVRAEYRCADTADAQAVQSLVDTAVAEFGGLHGVIHCAGVAGARSILELDDREFDDMLSPKTDGLILLDRATAAQPLDFFMCFSSVSALLGDLGSGAYAVGNRFMDSFVLWRDAQRAQGLRNGRSISVNWPLWATGGMEISGADASVFGFSGMQALSEAEGLEAFEKILRGGEDRVLVSIGDPQRVSRVLRVQDGIADMPIPPAQPAVVPSASPAHAPAPVAAPVANAALAAMPAPVPVSAPGEGRLARAEDYIKAHMASVTKTRATAIDKRASFEQCGLDSVLLLELHAAIKADFDELPKTALFEYDTATRLAQFLIAQYTQRAADLFGADAAAAVPAAPAAVAAPRPAPAAPPVALRARAQASRMSGRPMQGSTPSSRIAAPPLREEGVAVVGIAGEFPNSPDLQRFWDNLREGRDCIGRIPPERGFGSALNLRRSRSGRPIADAGGFIADVDLFDPALFRMTQIEADKADPQLRVLLRTAWRAVEDAAYTIDTLSQQRVGVFVGAMNEDFTWITSELQARADDYLGPGAVASDLSNRLSFLMNLRGPSLTLSTACSASLTALHLARRAILAGDCDAALVGGVNLSLHHSKYHLLHSMKVLSPDGQERTFDDSANGLVPSEGAGVVVLKRLDRAVEDGDHIHGVIRASRISHSGTGAGQFMPNIRVMEDTAADCVADAGIAVEDIGYIESHGTGTELGDPIELKALANALRRSTDATGGCAIGSKANLGHMEAASGLGSLIKVLLSMRHGQIAPCAKLRRVNSSFDHARSPFHFPQSATPWPKNARGTRVAGINSFGMGGSNAFAIVESFDAGVRRDNMPAEPAVFTLSARSADGLHAYATAVLEFLRREGGAGLADEVFADWAYVTQIGRTPWRHRLALIVRDAAELSAALDGWIREPGRAHDRAYACDSEGPAAIDTQRLVSGEAGAAFVASLLEERQLDRLAEFWVRGARIDWEALHRGRPRRRASFPGAPFESVRCDLRHLLPKDADIVLVANAQPVARDPVATRGDGPPIGREMGGADAPDAIELPEGAWCRLDALDALDAGTGRTVGETGDTLRDFWVERLGSAGDTAVEFAKAMPLDVHDEPDAGAVPLHVVSELVDSELLRTVRAFGRRHGIAIETLVAAAWAVLMNRHTKARCSQFGLLGATAAAGSPLLLPVRVRTVGRLKVLQWLHELQAELLRQHREALAPIERIREWVGYEPLFDTVVAFDAGGSADAGRLAAQDAGTPAIRPDGAHEPPRPRVELVASATGDSLELTLIYSARSPDYDKAGMLLEQFIVLLEGIVSNPDKMPSALGMRTRAESRERFWKTMEATTE